MQITDKLLKQITETKYLTTENTDRYRVILRIFYIHYEKLKYWLYQEEVYEEMRRNEYFKDYRPEQCQQDLAALCDWKNLLSIQDTRKVTSIEEFKNKMFRYQMSPYSVEIERLVIKLEDLSIEGASLEPSLLERICRHVKEISHIALQSPDRVYQWWNDLNNDFIRLNQNYQDYIRDLNSVRAEEMMKTREFLVFKDKLMEYLRTFVRSLQMHVGVIEGCIRDTSQETLSALLQKVTAYELSIPRIDKLPDAAAITERNRGRWESLEEWFVDRDGRTNEAGKLFDSTNEIIRKITRYAARISEQSSTGANRKEEYAKVASVFLSCRDINEAHRLSAMVFGTEHIIHLKGDIIRETDSYNSSVYDEAPTEQLIAPRIRTVREKVKRTAMRDCTAQKKELLEKTMKQIAQDRQKIRKLVCEGKIDFKKLPVIDTQVREILLKWISDALENAEHTARTEDGESYRVVIHAEEEKITVTCSDGLLTMPHMEIVFLEEIR